MTTPDQIDRAALENMGQRLRTMAKYQRRLTDEQFPGDRFKGTRASAYEEAAFLESVAGILFRTAPAGEQVVSNCDLTDPNNLARQQFMSTTPPAEGPVAIVRQRRRKEGRMNVVDTETHFLDEHCGADLPDGTKLYAHPPAPRGVTDGVMRQAADALRAVQASRDATPALIWLVDPALLALTAALEGESEKQATAAVPVEKLRLLQVTWRRANGDYPESQQDCADDLQRLIDEAEGKTPCSE